MYQRTQWMAAVVSQAHDDSDEELTELFEEAGIPAKEISDFLDARCDFSPLTQILSKQVFVTFRGDLDKTASTFNRYTNYEENT